MHVSSSFLFELGMYILIFYSPALIAGIVVIVLGARGKASWASPFCRKCKYDLRGLVPEETPKCPECGAKLDARRGIGYVRHRKRWSLIVIGILLLLLPVLNLSGLLLYQTHRRAANGGPGQVSSMSNAALVQYVSQAQNIDQPWGWREMADRIQKNSGITSADCDAVVSALTAYMKSQSPNGYNRPLDWQRELFNEALPRNLISDPVLFDFIDAYEGTQTRMDPIDRIDAGKQKIRCHISYGSKWQLQDSGVSLVVLRYPTEARIDGQPMAMAVSNAWRDNMDIEMSLGLPPGEHTLDVDVDVALADVNQLVGLNIDRALPKDWPKQVRRRWTVTGSRKFTVLAPDDQPVGTTTDPAMDPNGKLHATDAVVRTERGELKLAVVFKIDDTYQGAVGFDVTAQFPGQEQKAMRSLRFRAANNSRSYGGMEQSLKLEALDPSLRTVDLILTPNPSLQRSDPQVTEIWGQPITFKDVPLARYDLEAKGDASSSP